MSRKFTEYLTTDYVTVAFDPVWFEDGYIPAENIAQDMPRYTHEKGIDFVYSDVTSELSVTVRCAKVQGGDHNFKRFLNIDEDRSIPHSSTSAINMRIQTGMRFEQEGVHYEVVDASVNYEDQRVKCKIVFPLDAQQIGSFIHFELWRVRELVHAYLN